MIGAQRRVLLQPGVELFAAGQETDGAEREEEEEQHGPDAEQRCVLAEFGMLLIHFLQRAEVRGRLAGRDQRFESGLRAVRPFK